jgi:hypothetical protein
MNFLGRHLDDRFSTQVGALLFAVRVLLLARYAELFIDFFLDESAQIPLALKCGKLIPGMVWKITIAPVIENVSGPISQASQKKYFPQLHAMHSFCRFQLKLLQISGRKLIVGFFFNISA